MTIGPQSVNFPDVTELASGFRTVGQSGLVVSELGIGASTFGRSGMIATSQRAVDEIVARALDLGITYFDIADVYGDEPGLSETLLGNALGSRRDDVIIGSKFGVALSGLAGQDWGVRGSRRYIRRAVEGSLRRLKTDWIDLYQIHSPDPVTPVEETLAVLDDLVREGKVRYLGSSNFAAGKSSKRSSRHGSVASRDSFRPRTNTTSCGARPSVNFFRRFRTMGSASFLISHCRTAY